MSVRGVCAVLPAGVLLAVAPGCGSGDDAVSLQVELRTSYGAGEDFEAVRTEVDPEGGPSVRDERIVARGESFSRPREVASFMGLSPGRVTVRVQLLGDGAVVAQRSVALDLDDDRAVTVSILEDGPVDGGPRDAGVDGANDGGGNDSGTDGGGPSTGMCPDGPCNLLTSEGCSAGQACFFDAMAESPTCMVAGPGGDGDACSTLTDCKEGFHCLGGRCRYYCCGSDERCPTGQACGGGLICMFVDECDPVEQTGCADGEGCYPAVSAGSVSCATPTSDAGTQGDSCELVNGCEPGFACIGDPGTCAQLCDPTIATPGCPDGTSCGGLAGFADDVGVCDST